MLHRVPLRGATRDERMREELTCYTGYNARRRAEIV